MILVQFFIKKGWEGIFVFLCVFVGLCVFCFYVFVCLEAVGVGIGELVELDLHLIQTERVVVATGLELFVRQFVLVFLDATIDSSRGILGEILTLLEHGDAELDESRVHHRVGRDRVRVFIQHGDDTNLVHQRVTLDFLGGIKRVDVLVKLDFLGGIKRFDELFKHAHRLINCLA